MSRRHPKLLGKASRSPAAQSATCDRKHEHCVRIVIVDAQRSRWICSDMRTCNQIDQCGLTHEDGDARVLKRMP